jgi:predicted permease
VLQGLKAGGEAHAMGRRRLSLRNLLVIGQVAASLVLLLCAGMFLRSLGKLHSVELGFNSDNVALLSVDLALQGYSAEKGLAFYEQAIELIERMPGVVTVEAARRAPVGMGKVGQKFVPEGKELNSKETYFGFNIVGTSYFEALQIPILRGRSFTPQDRPGASRVAIINQTMADRFWPGQDPIGKQLRRDNNTSLEIIGVCKTGKYHRLTEGPTPFVYLPLLQNYQPALTFHVRTHASPVALLPALRQELLMLDSALAVFDVKTMNEHLAVPMLPVRIGALLLAIFGGLALGLAMLGLYGVMSYAVTQRTREIGIRAALGARRSDVLRLIMRQGMKLTFVGVFIGLVLGSGLTAVIASQLFGVSTTDVVTLTGMSLTLISVALLACWLPARRAARVDPMLALRSE